jgi:hypothetical protein
MGDGTTYEVDETLDRDYYGILEPRVTADDGS